jgi:predicted nucleic acid-binding protein
MNCMNAIDTNVFVYAFDADEAVKRLKAQELLDHLMQRPAETILLWQVAGELLSRLRKWESAGRISAEHVADHFRDVLAMFALRPPASSCFATSFGLRSRYSLSHWDSMLLAACEEAGVEVLFSEDFSADAVYDGVKIINPFA